LHFDCTMHSTIGIILPVRFMAIQHEILQQYWGFANFRSRQEEIVVSILHGKDTLALLPTGGGKSICFQVPALCMPGVCLVISPLVALMHDQVMNLKKRGIHAVLVNSSLKHAEIDRVLDNCVYGDVKFLYVSPERLKNELFLERFKKMNISMIAVDEAHCISQWGYDFRPDYLSIAEIRDFKPSVPVLALTASATPAVVADIQDKLNFEEHHVIGISFARPNLSYNVTYQEDKDKKVLEICKKMSGCGIVYCGTRKRTREMSILLAKHGVSSTYYNAGLSLSDREAAFGKWMRNQARVICATNAFGMGIDKPDVRFVVHADMPSQPEAYFQEAGRGGRDGHTAYAVLVWNQGDVIKMHQNIEVKYPPKDFLRKVYKCIGNYLQLAPGSGKDISYPFDMSVFTSAFDLKPAETAAALKLLELAGYIAIDEVAFMPSRLHVKINKQELYSFQVANPSFDVFLRTILRMYGGLFEQYTAIREGDIAANLKLDRSQVVQRLQLLSQNGIIDYQPRTDMPQLTYLTGRMHEDHLVFSKEVHENRKRNDQERATAMERFVTRLKCRSIQLLEYFGEKFPEACGHCDVCRESKKHGMTPAEADAMEKAVMNLALMANVSIDDLPTKLSTFSKEHLLELVRWKIDKGELMLTDKLMLAVPDME
jgi:ATP-dependent DNA helicase RecQ